MNLKTISQQGLTALVLAGGRGERLRPYTQDRPKSMVMVNGQPLLYHHLSWLRRGGVDCAYVLCGYKHEAIQEYFGEGSAVGMRLEYVVESEPLGRGGALKNGLSRVPSHVGTVVATNGDILAGQALGQVIDAHRQRRGLATIMLSPLVSPYGIVTTGDNGRIQEFVEKPVLPYWVNAGVYVLERAILDTLPAQGDHETTTFPAVAREGRLFGFKSSAWWLAVDTVKDLNQASKLLAELHHAD